MEEVDAHGHSERAGKAEVRSIFGVRHLLEMTNIRTVTGSDSIPSLEVLNEIILH